MCWVDSGVSPPILQAHMFHVIHHHIIITNLFLVTLNKRESRGGQTDRCPTAVFRATTVNDICSLVGVESRFATQIRTRTAYRKTLLQKLQLFRYATPQNLNPRRINHTMANTYSTSHLPRCVVTISLHVACNGAAKWFHVVELGARPQQLLEDVLATKIHQHCPCYECFYVRLHPHMCFAKVNLQDSIQVWLNGSFKATQK